MHITLLYQVGFIHILKGVFFLTDGCRQGLYAHRAAIKLFQNRQEQPLIHLIKPP